MQNSFIILLLYLSVALFTLGKPAWPKDLIYFLPEKNNLQILPQKFEYNLLDNSTIKIGDIVIDSNNLTMQLNAEKSNFSFTFTWPAGLFQEADLVLFNNYGKVIKNYTVTKNQIELVVETQEKAENLLRKDKAIFKTPLIDDALIEEVKYLPFFKFCLQRKEENTRIDLCSVELYLSSKDGKPNIKMRSENKKKAQILVNNAEVGEQGIIFLNDLTESINFRAQSESGAKLEIETRLKPVDFKDVIISDDGKSVTLTGSGSFPVSNKNVKKISDSLWQIRLPTEFPVFYIQGEGGIPFRQEFFVRGGLPVESLRTFSTNLVSSTYSKSEKMLLEIPKGSTLSSKDANSKVTLSKISQNIEWSITGLEKGQESKRVLYLKKDNSEFAIYQSFYRVPAFEAQLATTYLPSEKINFVSLGLDYWLNNKRSGLGLIFDQSVTKTTSIEKWTNTELHYKHRIKSGMNFQDDSYYISAQIRSSTIGELGFSHLGVGVGRKYLLTSNILKYLGDWTDWSFKYFLGSKSKEAEIKSLMALDFRIYNRISTSYLINYGISLQNFSVVNMGDFKTSQPQFAAGLTYLF